MAVQVSYPGVYIEEFAPGAPIEGVGTSNAAFIGVATQGTMETAVKIASWDQFRAEFGESPVPGFFLWYAVRGFFENGGQICYVVRATNGTRGTRDLMNRAGTPVKIGTLVTRQPTANDVEVTIKDVSPARFGADVYKATAAYTSATTLSVKLGTPADSAKFSPGDLVDLSTGTPDVRIQRILGDTIFFETPVTLSSAGAGNLSLANLPIGTRTLRVVPSGTVPADVLVPGAVLTIKKGAVAQSLVLESVQTEPLTPGGATLRLTFRTGLTIAVSPTAGHKVNSEEINVDVEQSGTKVSYQNLGLDPAHPRYYVDIVNASKNPVRIDLLEPPPASATLLESFPADPSGTKFKGTAEDLSTINQAEFQRALDVLRAVDDVNLVSAPDCIRLSGAAAVQTSLIAHCEQLGDRFAVLDARPNVRPFDPALDTQRAGLDSTRGYAGLYYPWLRVPSATPGPLVLVPPSGHVCGVIARSDNLRGVHKAPANEIVNGALGVEFTMSDPEQGQLNLFKNINVIRVFQGGGRPVLNGARTTATDRNWQYVNIRRLFLYLEESIQEGIRWAIFEPNNLALWEKLRRSITEFLMRAWRDGALFGETPKDAFYVRIDEVLNPPADRALGRLTIEIGVKPSYPAEFIIVRIGIWQGGSAVSEA
jgi:phage tail sheath protein FI